MCTAYDQISQIQQVLNVNILKASILQAQNTQIGQPAGIQWEYRWKIQIEEYTRSKIGLLDAAHAINDVTSKFNPRVVGELTKPITPIRNIFFKIVRARIIHPL